MSVDATTASTAAASSALSGVTGSATGSSSLGESDFLRLLVTQLKSQNPLSPMDDQAFVAQLAQFSSLEQLTNINSGITKLTTATNQQQMFSAVSFIGKDVKAAGDTVVKSGSSVNQLTYTLSDPATKVAINVMDSNYNIVRTVNVGSQAAGNQTYQWDGKDASGHAVPDGTYTVGISALKADGTSMTVNTVVTGTVTGVTTKNGAMVLTTQDGRTLNITDVMGVSTPSTNTSS